MSAPSAPSSRGRGKPHAFNPTSESRTWAKEHQSAPPSTKHTNRPATKQATVLDIDACKDEATRWLQLGRITVEEWKVLIAILDRVCAETRIAQPGTLEGLIPELVAASGVSRSKVYYALNRLGPEQHQRVEEHHLLKRIRVYPNETFPVDGRETSYGGVAVQILFADQIEFAKKGELPKWSMAWTQVHRVDSSPPDGLKSTAWTQVHEMDILDRRVSLSDLSSSPSSSDPSSLASSLDPAFKPPPSPPRQAVAPSAPGLTTPAEPARTSGMRYAQGVTRQQGTAPNRAENAAREGQKSRGSSAHAEAPGASVRPRDDEPGELDQRVQIALDYYALHLGKKRDLSVSPWSERERSYVREALCAPRWADRKGVPLSQLLLTFFEASKSDHNRNDPSRQTLKYLCTADDRIETMAAVAQNRGEDVRAVIRKGLSDPEEVDASKRQPEAATEPPSSGRKVVHDTEHMARIVAEVAAASQRGDFAAAQAAAARLLDADGGQSKESRT